MATFGEHTNKENGRRQWTFQDDGSLTLEDGRQLYANRDGWVAAALEDEQGTQNNLVLARRPATMSNAQAEPVQLSTSAPLPNLLNLVFR